LVRKFIPLLLLLQSGHQPTTVISGDNPSANLLRKRRAGYPPNFIAVQKTSFDDETGWELAVAFQQSEKSIAEHF